MEQSIMEHPTPISSNQSIQKNTNNENRTISILTSYAFPKTSQHYADKGKTCILDDYHDEIIQYFTKKELEIKQFHTSSITKSEFVSNIIKYIDTQNGTENEDNYRLQTAIKKLYTILQFSQHAHCEPVRSNTKYETITTEIEQKPSLKIMHKRYKKNVQQTDKHEIQRRKSNRISMVHELVESAGKILTLQQQAEILKDVADEQQKKLIQTEEKEKEYKRTVNELQEQLNSEKTRIYEISNVNKALQNELEENKEKMLTVERRLSVEMNKLENENEKLREMINKLSNTKNNAPNRNDLVYNNKKTDEIKPNVHHIGGNKTNLKRNTNKTGASVSIKNNDTTMVTVNLQRTTSNITQSEAVKSKETEEENNKLLVLNEEDIANLSKFYQTMDVDEIQSENDKKRAKQRKNNKKLNFWDRLFGDFHCVPS